MRLLLPAGRGLIPTWSEFGRVLPGCAGVLHPRRLSTTGSQGPESEAVRNSELDRKS